MEWGEAAADVVGSKRLLAGLGPVSQPRPCEDEDDRIEERADIMAKPVIQEMPLQEAVALLERNHVGRLAIARKNQVDIQPIHYVYRDEWIYGRTSLGAKIEMTGTDWWPVAFEVDEVDGLFDWRSVVVHGGFYVLNPKRPWQKEAWEAAVSALRELIPETLTEDDPTPDRTIVFRIAAQDLTGRRATSR